MFCRNCGYDLGDSKYCSMCGTKASVSEEVFTKAVINDEPKQSLSTNNALGVQKRQLEYSGMDIIRLLFSRFIQMLAWCMFGIVVLGFIAYILEGLPLDADFFVAVVFLSSLGVLLRSFARKFGNVTSRKEKKQKTKSSRISILIIILICVVICAVVLTSKGECENGHQWQAATLEKPYTCSDCGATRGEPAQPCSECETTGFILCNNCDELGQATCSVCNGEKMADCPDCKGSGKVNCTSCAGSGKGGVEESRCYKCGGNGQVKSSCSNCGGVGSVVIRSYGNTSVDDCLKCAGKGSVYKECTFCDGAGTKKSFKKCNQCNGSGTIKDEQCNGQGKVPCTNCNDDGIEVCSLCEKTKQITCDNCEGTGLIQNVPMTSVTLTAFNLEEDNDREVCSSVPVSADYLQYAFKFESLESNKTYTLRQSDQWPGKKATPSDWVWEDVKDGDILWCVWKNGYETSKTGTLVIEIRNDETGEVLGTFEMNVE